jgi:hypothetical protein
VKYSRRVVGIVKWLRKLIELLKKHLLITKTKPMKSLESNE